MRRLAALLVLGPLAAHATAQIALKPKGGEGIELRPKTVNVDARIEAAVAESIWTYEFRNSGGWSREADFLIKIPKGGVVTGFAYWFQGEKVAAKVAANDRARAIYSAIRDRQRDPALIELVGKDTFRVRVFPIEANADLKVELKIVQALPDSGQGSTLVLPLKKLGRVESARVVVRSDTPLLDSLGAKGTEVVYEAKNQPARDYRITALRPPAALVSSLRAARSGGASAFFVLTLVPSKGLGRPRWKLEGDVAEVRSLVTERRRIVLVGRLKPGAKRLRAWVLGNGFRAFSDTPVVDRVDPNSAPVKLWAWSKIQSSRSRTEIQNLSMRHTVPSRYTSWIAIPDSERKRMAREIARAELQVEIARVVPTLLRVGLTSAQGKAITARIEARAKSLGVEVSEAWNETLADRADELATRWMTVVGRHGESSPTALRLRSQLRAFERLGVQVWKLDNYYQVAASAVAQQVLEDRLARRETAAARRRETELRRLATHTDISFEQHLQAQASNEVLSTAHQIAEAERTGKATEAARRRLRELTRATGGDPNAPLSQARVRIAQNRLYELTSELSNLVKEPRPDEAALARHADERRREIARIRVEGASPSDAMHWVWYERGRLFAAKVARGEATVDQLPAEKAEVERLAKIAGVEPQMNWEPSFTNEFTNARSELERLTLEARRDRTRIDDVKRRIERLAPGVSSAHRQFEGQWSYRNEPNQDLRNAYVRKRHEGKPADGELQRLFEADMGVHTWRPNYAAWRRERLQVLTELDRLDEQRPDPEVVARKAQLEARAKELHARMGDPIVSVEAPGARQVWAILPDGSRLSMHRVPGTDRWEGRFDVPPGVADGRYEVRVFVDGEERARMPIHVDNTSPALDLARDGDRLVAVADEPLARAVALLPNGSRVEMIRQAPDRFSLVAPVGTKVVATDRAHNRTDSAATPARGEGSWSNPDTVSTLAFIGDRLWVGTVNDGGGFQGEARSQAHPWPKQAVSVRGDLHVRYSDGAVMGPQGAIKLPRPATAIAVDRDRLLVGHVGGWSVVGGEAAFPPDLAGVVVTAVLAEDDRIWLGTQGRGLAEVDRRTMSVTWHDERHGIREDWITALGRDEQGRLVAGTFVAGAFVRGRTVWEPVIGTEGTCVVGIANGWIATRQGVWFTDRKVSDLEATTLTVGNGAAWIGTRTGPRQLPILKD